MSKLLPVDYLLAIVVLALTWLIIFFSLLFIERKKERGVKE